MSVTNDCAHSKTCYKTKNTKGNDICSVIDQIHRAVKILSPLLHYTH